MPRAPWQQINGQSAAWEGSRFSVRVADDVVFPGGRRGRYEWVVARDQVRVAAVVGGGIVLVEQFQHLPNRSFLQLPGGTLDPGETPRQAAERELAEETGYRQGRWTEYPATYPLPGITAALTHLWVATDPRPGSQQLEDSEVDLRVHHLTLAQACQAVRDGEVACAPSALLILAVAGRHAEPDPWLGVD
jgi:ADP-ribose pyrophosphatase